MVTASVSRETQDKFDRYAALLRKWQTRTNLVASSTLEDLERRHIADSQQLMTIRPQMNHVIDLGSGGGFPGMVLAILLADRGGHVDLIESNHKKAAFLRQVMQVCQGVGLVHAARIEDTLGQLNKPDTITARALASLDTLLDMTHMKITDNTVALFHKGRDYKREIEEARRRWRFDLVKHNSIIDTDSVILEISHVQPR